jgi:hypothetical protein
MAHYSSPLLYVLTMLQENNGANEKSVWSKIISRQTAGTCDRQSGRNKQKAGTYGRLVHSCRTASKHIDGRQTHWKADTTIAAGRHKDDRQTH